MKTIKLLGAAAMLALGLASCSDDKLDNGGSDVAEIDHTMYLNVAISSTNGFGSRAYEGGDNPGFEAGEAIESQIGTAYFVFYEEELGPDGKTGTGKPGKQVGEIAVVSTFSNNVTTDATGSVLKSYVSVVPVSVRKGDHEPKFVMCYVNPVTPANIQNPIDYIETLTRQEVTTGTGANMRFPMSNSVYYDVDGNLVRATKIEEGQLFDTEAEAKEKAEEDGETAKVNIYVERYAAKVKFAVTQTDAAIPGYAAGEGTQKFTLKFVPEYWVVNAEGKTSYITKSYRAQAANGTILGSNYTLADANNIINKRFATATEGAGTILTKANQWAWNNAGLHRSFWGCSPAYYSTQYPEVASDIDPANPDKYELIYLTENQVRTGGYGNPVNAVGETPAKLTDYVRETTTGTVGLTSKNPAAAVPSIALYGKYTITPTTTGATALPANTSFYTYMKNSDGNANIYFDVVSKETDATGAANGNSAVNGGTSMLRRFINQLSVLVKRTGEGTTEDPYVFTQFDPSKTPDLQYLVSNLTIKRPVDAVLTTGVTGEAVEDQVKLAARRRTIQLNAAPTADQTTAAGFTLCYASGNSYVPVTTANLTDVNKIISQNVGYADYYNQASAYFNIPIKHLGWYRKGNLNRTATTPEGGATTYTDNTTINWNNVMVGDFGLVRNHVYSINVTTIKGLGTAIADPTDPTVPPAETTDYFVAYRLNILNWAIVPTQNVEL
ncbi:fimbria major subunit [uncultured Muribaculum sp.]|uniref:fimbria major subunit n=1 Tax=uncultured Muribaculum sp. TaxID=1918613 RepID=UPI0025A5835F|nr:fimbria major subunit [uncultured Muribaculum sp.]